MDTYTTQKWQVSGLNLLGSCASAIVMIKNQVAESSHESQYNVLRLDDLKQVVIRRSPPGGQVIGRSPLEVR